MIMIIKTDKRGKNYYIPEVGTSHTCNFCAEREVGLSKTLKNSGIAKSAEEKLKVNEVKVTGQSVFKCSTLFFCV